MTNDRVIKHLQDILDDPECIPIDEDERVAVQTAISIVRKKDPNKVRDKLAEFLWEFDRAVVKSKPVDRELGLDKPWVDLDDLHKLMDQSQANYIVSFLTALARDPDLDVVSFSKKLAKLRVGRP